ncbi:MAG: hypothetical protein AAB768_03685 [Patescibacteria group bacterium]
MAKKKSEIRISKSETISKDELDPKEEKILDWILNGIIVFVLGWLGLGILLSVGGLFHLWG